MKRIGYHSLALAVLALGLCASVATSAPYDPPPPPYNFVCPGVTPTPNSAYVETRLWNDCPTSTITTVNTYPSEVSITDADRDCFGYANKHIWKFSSDGGATPAWFENCSMYEFCADVTVTGDGNGEAGIHVSPWWYRGDGAFMLNYQTGEIACFGGRLPFYSFTAAYGVHYVKGTKVTCKIAYNPRNLNAAFPGEIKYLLYMGGTTYDSGWLNFDMGNPNPGEGDVHGLYGALSLHTVGGFFQPYMGAGVPVTNTVKFENICFNPIPTPAATKTWGQLKSIYR